VEIASRKGQKAVQVILKSPLGHLGPAVIKLRKIISYVKVGQLRFMKGKFGALKREK